MKFKRSTILVLLAVTALSSAVFGQNDTFSDPNVEYTFTVPDNRWKVINQPSATSPNVEMVFVDRTEGHFEVRKLSTPATMTMADIIREEEQKLRFMQGFVAGREERFGGKLSGSAFNFEFVRSGRAMSGRFYFLRSGDTTYLLRFTGFKDSIRSIRNQTDVIARTFEVKTP